MFNAIANYFFKLEAASYLKGLKALSQGERAKLLRQSNQARQGLIVDEILPENLFTAGTLPPDVILSTTIVRLNRAISQTTPSRRGDLLLWLYTLRALMRPSLRQQAEAIWREFQLTKNESDVAYMFSDNAEFGFIPSAFLNGSYPQR